LPWYGKILKPNVLGAPENNREIATQMPIDLGLLNPSGSNDAADKTRQDLGFEKTDIVFGCFARLEKFNEQYIKIAKAILTKIPNSRLLIAGTNSNSFLRAALQEFLPTKRAVILGFSDSHALGHILTFGLETTPTLSGSTVLELYAKSVPVITCSENVTDLGYIAEARVPDLVYDSVDAIIADIFRFTDESWRLAMGDKCLSFVSEMSERCKSSYFEILDK
jgi:predicted O-linked N-acetylglucosamine transferase (SPINDLY family)